jgi:hypothetical protein
MKGAKLMTEFSKLAVLTGDLDSHSDQALRDLIDDARQILKAREARRKKDALAEIRRIARAHKLDVAVTKRARRGRPPKESRGL